MTDFTSKITRAMEHTLGSPRPDRLLIVGLSGGPDSVALLHALVTAGHRCLAAHCNYGLRPGEADRDEAHARRIAASLATELRVRRCDVESRRRLNGGSVEMACRDLRYEWFAQLIAETGAEAVAVAHHADDNVETVLLNLMRGTGLRGLCGMSPVATQPVKVVRPLLEVTRDDILGYLGETGLDFVTDSSNLSCDYTRNAIRNRVLPAMEQALPQARHGILLTAGIISRARDLVADCLSRCGMTDRGLDLDRLRRDFPASADFLAYEALAPCGFSAAQAAEVLTAAQGAVFVADGRRYIIDGPVLRPCVETAVPDFPFEVEMSERADTACTDTVAWFSADVLEGSPLQCRTRREGDAMTPMGMTGRKKLKKVFTDAGVRADRKNVWPLLVKGDTILWAPGLCRSAHFAVKPSDRSAVRIRYIGPAL